MDGHLKLLIEHTASGVRQSLERGEILTQMVAQDPALRGDLVDRAALEDRLVYFNGLLPQFHHLTLVDPVGKVLASSTYNYRGTWEVQEVFRSASAGQVSISPAHLNLRSHEPAVTFAAPVEGPEGEVNGIVVGELSIGSITNLATGLKVGERGHTSVVNSLGQIIADTDPGQLMRTRTVDQRWAIDAAAVIKADLEGEDLLYALAPVTVEGMTKNWWVVLQVPTSQAYSYVNDTTRLMLFVAIGVVGMVIVVSLVLGDSISRPVRRVIFAARGMAGGDMTARASVSQGGEVGELAQTFNSMAQDLQTRIRYTDNIAGSMIDSLVVTSADGTIQRVNNATLEMLGYQENDVLGRPFETILDNSQPESGSIVEKLFRQGSIREAELTYLTRDQSKISVSFSGALMRDEDGNVEGIVCVAQDISDRRRAEQERQSLEIKALAQSKLATLGEMATGIAHEINQPLTYISTMNQVLLEDLQLNNLDLERATERLEESHRQVGRITRIVRHLRTFGRPEETEMTPVDLKDVLDNALLLMAERLRLNNIILEQHVGEGIPKIRGSSNQLEQVLINLFQNSLDAFNGRNSGARIVIRARISVDKSSLILEFSDNGSGIPSQHLGKVYEPFFTTKPVGQGTGLGLSIVYGIIQGHRGSISCESRVNEGTTFIITIPTERGQDA